MRRSKQVTAEIRRQIVRSGIDTLSIADMMASLGLTQGGLPKLTAAYLPPSRIDDFKHACPLAARGAALRRADQQTREVAAARNLRIPANSSFNNHRSFNVQT